MAETLTPLAKMASKCVKKFWPLLACPSSDNLKQLNNQRLSQGVIKPPWNFSDVRNVKTTFADIPL
jgi:hypothetical protein